MAGKAKNKNKVIKTSAARVKKMNTQKLQKTSRVLRPRRSVSPVNLSPDLDSSLDENSSTAVASSPEKESRSEPKYLPKIEK